MPGQSAESRFAVKITLLTVGKIRERWWKDAIAEYVKRIGAYARVTIVEVEDEKTPENASEALEEQIRQKEGRRLLAKLPPDAYLIAMAIQGKDYSSPELASHLQDLMNRGNSHLAFAIGGSLGLSGEVLSAAREQISFSRLTFPHQMMRVILLEQIYRSFRILRSEPYHK